MGKEKKDKWLSFRCTVGLKGKIETLAKRNHMTVSNFGEQVLERYADKFDNRLNTDSD